MLMRGRAPTPLLVSLSNHGGRGAPTSKPLNRPSTGRAIWIPAVRQAHHEGVGGRLASLLSESLPSTSLSAPSANACPPTPLMLSLSKHGGVEHPLPNRSTGTGRAIWIPAVRQAHHEGVGGPLASLLSEPLPSAFLSAPSANALPPTPLMLSLSKHACAVHSLFQS